MRTTNPLVKPTCCQSLPVPRGCRRPEPQPRARRARDRLPGFLGVAPGLLLAIALGGATVHADWNVGEPYKMHFPQMPDVNGWDIEMFTVTSGFPAIADDWRCTASGPVSDIHIWYSTAGDTALPPFPFTFSIWSDNPDPDGAGPQFSTPKSLLWSATYAANQVTTRFWGTGDQGYYAPASGAFAAHDHQNILQLNLENIANPFIQEAGKVYWLGISVPHPPPTIGWKTSQDHFNDDAVWYDGGAGAWRELIDPLSGQSLDLAFVITPEPHSGGLAVAAGLLGLATARRRRPNARRTSAVPEPWGRIR